MQELEALNPPPVVNLSSRDHKGGDAADNSKNEQEIHHVKECWRGRLRSLEREEKVHPNSRQRSYDSAPFKCIVSRDFIHQSFKRTQDLGRGQA